jgi:DNA sulfur modification protein DndB
MAIVIPAIRGKLGNTEYYETTMKVRDLVHAVRPPREIDGWANFSIEERMQREPDVKRIQTQLAPYLAKNADRFFGSIIVLVYKGEITFEAMSELAKNIPAAYKQNAQRIGFITIDGGTLIVLDGQHRHLALRMVQQGEAEGPCAPEVGEDEVCVIFIMFESDLKTRRIFNTVNRYAKQTSRGDNIITSEDDGYAIVTRWLLRETEPLGKPADLVNWKSNTLTKRSTQLTTISAVYETVKLILLSRGVEKLPEQERPKAEDLDTYLHFCSEVWDAILHGLKPYQDAVANMSKIPDMRDDEARTALLFKPAAQIAVVDALLRAEDNGHLKMSEAIERMNRIPTWSMTADIWQGVMVKPSGAIDAGPEARRRMATLLCYLIAADRLGNDVKFVAWKSYNEARGADVDAWIASKGARDGSKFEDLPKPIEGTEFTVADAKLHVRESGDLEAA